MPHRVPLEPAVPFRFGGHVALDFVNTIDSWVRPAQRDYIHSFDLLVAWAHQVGLINRSTARLLLKNKDAEAMAVHAAAIQLRTLLYRIFEAVIAGTPPPRADLDAFNVFLTEARERQRLVGRRGSFAFEWDGDMDARTPIMLVSLAAADFLERYDLTRLKQCPGPDGCGWLFYDESRNRSRRWCSMDYCGSFAKARRFAEAHRNSL